MKKERYTKVEVCQELGINLATLWKWQTQRGCPGPSLRKRTGRVRPVIYTAEDLARIKAWRDGEERRE